MLHSFEAALARSWPPEQWQDVTVVVAVSGGADSVALLRALCALHASGPGRIVAAHLNHGLRGEQAAADERFVVELCEQLGVQCEVGHARVAESAQQQGDGLEAAARKERYRFLAEVAGRVGGRFVATAHTADDQAETILHHVLRGTGLRGLGGMRRTRRLGPAVLIRPLLEFRREELRNYLRELGQPYREDRSNTDLGLTRNRIRHELLPRLAAEFNPRVVEALVRLGRLASEAHELLAQQAQELGRRCLLAEDQNSLRLDAAQAADQPPYLVREMLAGLWHSKGWPMQAMGWAEWEALAGMLLECAQDKLPLPAARMFPGAIEARPEPGALVLRSEPFSCKRNDGIL